MRFATAGGRDGTRYEDIGRHNCTGGRQSGRSILSLSSPPRAFRDTIWAALLQRSNRYSGDNALNNHSDATQRPRIRHKDGQISRGVLVARITP